MALTARKIINAISGKFSLADIPGFPLEIYNNQLAVYGEQERWFKGLALDEQTLINGRATDLYPLRINPILSTVMKHAYILFGEVTHDGRPLVQPKLIPTDDTEEAKKRATKAEEALNHVWWENNGRALMFENGTISQIYGGCVFKLSYVPWEWDEYRHGFRKIPIRIERINPKAFVGRPSPGDMFRLSEAWIIGDIPMEEAARWGYTGLDDSPTFVEYWSIEEHRTWINDQEVEFPVAQPDQGEPSPRDGEGIFNGKNPFGFVPIVYIPHVRTGHFHGDNAFDHLKGLVKDINARFADYGDAVNDDSHVPLAMRNVTGSPQMKRIADGIDVIDLGTSTNVTGNEAQPDLFEVRKARASSSMQSLLSELVQQYRRDSFVPAVAEGEDEGSQRSALTLVTRFWPLTSHVGTERIYFGAGLDILNTYILKMMAIKKLGDINNIHTKMRMKQSWAPMLPRDREAEVQEWSSRAQNNLGSVEHLLEMTRDVDDIAEERENILKWLEDVAEVQAKADAKYGMPSGSLSTGTDPNNLKPGKNPVKPEKTIDQKVGGGGGEK